MPSAKTFFNEQEKTLILDAIRQAESQTSGEIRVHIENFCFGNEVKRAQKIFERLKMTNTKERNGVLIYIAVGHKKVAVIGDKGIHEKLGDVYWQTIVGNLTAHFKSGKKAEGLASGIAECGSQLGRFFPRAADDTDELSNEISY
jgi:uncharacterized membrane protein